MASIKINDLNVAGASLFADRESYLDEVDDNELAVVKGGIAHSFLFLSALILGAVASVKITQAFKSQR